MKYVVIILLIFINISTLPGTEIYGTIDEDTTIGPEGNPWYMTSSLWVEEEVTLTILPGTEIYITAAYTDDYWNFASSGSEPEAKAITIYGSIRAIGTEADSILFTRYPDYPDFRWGSIRLYSEQPEDSIFRHCIVEYSAFYNDEITGDDGGIASHSGVTIEYCRFQDNYCSINLFDYGNSDYYPTIIYGCSFINTDDNFLYYNGDDLGIKLNINP